MSQVQRIVGELRGLAPHVPFDDFLDTVNISLKHKYIFVTNPKCACSTVQAILIRLELSDKAFEFADHMHIHLREYSPLLNPLQVGDFRRLAQDESFFRFCFVRNPYHRILSCYLDKIKNDRPPKRTLLRQIGRNPNEPFDISFREFVNIVARQPVGAMNRHWRVQYYQTLQDSMSYHLVGRFESFREDMDKVSDALGCQLSDFDNRTHQNRTDAGNLLDEYYDQSLRDAVFQTYRKDFEHFGYDR